MLPALGLFLISFLVMAIPQACAFMKELTPYPKRCAIFSPLFSVVIAAVSVPFSANAVINAIGTGAVNLSFLWMFSGLLISDKAIKK